jgi:hypothetical protein
MKILENITKSPVFALIIDLHDVFRRGVFRVFVDVVRNAMSATIQTDKESFGIIF